MEGSPLILKFHNTWLILSTEGDPTDDRTGVAAVAPRDSKVLNSALNLRVANIDETYKLWQSRGAEFLTTPKEHTAEIRCYLRDPDGHLIELGQSKQQGKAVPDTAAHEVLIIGAGPTGLTLAISLLVRGRDVAIVDKVAEGDTTSRAAVVYPATLEELDPYGVGRALGC
jgi:NADPH-dependent 2,4-dienoyl-CoA reductase/sulfur reductase-like enzyme